MERGNNISEAIDMGMNFFFFFKGWEMIGR